MLKQHFDWSGHCLVALLAAAALAACRDATAPRDVSPSAGSATQDIASAQPLETFYGPERFIRGKGAPETFTRQIPTVGFEAPFVLHVRSGDASGANRVSSATVRLDGRTLLGPSAFSQQQGEWSFPVTLGATASLSVSLASAPGSLLDIWIEGQRAGTLFCEDGSPTAIGDLQQAIDATPAGGTVLVCPGTHRMPGANITKALTIQGIGAAKPVIDFGGLCCGFRIDGAVGGPVRIRGLQFQNGKYQEILVSGPTDSVVIEGSEFYPRSTGVWGMSNGVAANATAGVVRIQNNTFTGGDVGVVAGFNAPGPHGTIEIVDNSFTGQDIAIHADGAASVHVEQNRFSDCGPNMCIGTFTFANGTLELLRNTFSVDVSRQTGNVIQLDAGTYLINGNTISGSGGTRNPNDQQTWPIRGAAIAVGGQATLSGNRISGAWTGLGFGVTVTAASGSDNTISKVGSVLYVYQSASVTLDRNDFTAYAKAIDYINTPGTVLLRCNWWGSAAGPQNVNWGATLYTPWATEPIANQPAVACNP